MRILHLITTIERGGAENQLLILVRHQKMTGNTVDVVYLKGASDLKDAFEQFSQVFDLSNISLLRQILQLQRLLVGYEIVHAHLPRAELILSLLFKRGCKFIASKHNMEAFWPMHSSFMSLVLARYVYFRMNAVIAISHAVSRHLIDLSEIPDSGLKKHFIIHYGYDERFEMTNKSTEVNLVVCVARLVAQKNIQTLLFAINLLRNSQRLLKLEVYGEGQMKEELIKITVDLNIENRAIFKGKTKDIVNVLQRASILVLPSLYEGFGMILIEAMQSRVPIVAARNSAILEVLGYDFPFLFETLDFNDLSEKILMLTDPVNREIALQYQDKKLAEFNPSQMYRKIMDVYQA